MKRNMILLIIVMLISTALSACSPKDDIGATPEPTPTATPLPTATPEPEPTPEPLYTTKTFRLSDSHPDGYPTVLGDQKFAELISELTDGAWSVEVHNNGILGDERSVVEQVQSCVIDFARVGTGALGRIAPEMNVFSLPYLFKDSDHMFRVLDGSVGDEFLNMMYKDGLLGLCWFDTGARGFYNTKKEVHSPADMEGMKIRVQDNELMTALASSLDAEPVTVAFSDVYAGLLSGDIDGAEGNSLNFFSASHDDTAKFYTYSAHIRSPEMIIVNTGVWESMTPDEQIIIKQCALEAAQFERDEWLKQEAEYERLAAVSGVTVTTPTPDELQQFIDATAPVYELDFFKDFKEIIEKIKNTP